MFARLASANLTRGKGGIGQTFSDSDYVRSIRYGVRSDDKPVIFMPSDHFNALHEEPDGRRNPRDVDVRADSAAEANRGLIPVPCRARDKVVNPTIARPLRDIGMVLL